MHPDLERQLAVQRAQDIRREVSAARRVAVAGDEGVVIRAARRDEQGALASLAALDDQLPPIGDVLVAEVDGSIAAALPMGGGRAIADPFRPTLHLTALLEARADQIASSRRVGRARRMGRHGFALLRRTA